MPLQQMPTFKPVADKNLDIPQPGIGGLNLADLEFEQEVSQSPYMKNVMYRNGAFSKRYGQKTYSDYSSKGVVYSAIYYDGSIFVHAGTKIYLDGTTITDVTDEYVTLPESEGVFIVFMQKLYYLVSGTSGGTFDSDKSFIYEYRKEGNNPKKFYRINAYIPDVLYNCYPSGDRGADTHDDYNVLSDKETFIYNGTEATVKYNVGMYDQDRWIDWTHPENFTIKVDGSEWEYDPTATTGNKYKIDISGTPDTYEIVFATAPGEGSMNVEMTFVMKHDIEMWTKARPQTLNCRIFDTYGGQYNSRVFLAGDGESHYFWSASGDISYFPAENFATLGNTEYDITGFGRQYNALIAFKPTETYQIVSYIETTSTTVVEEDVGLEYFRNILVNPRIGCDAPHSIQVINNLLTWFNSKLGVCTLVSTNIADERNIRVLSRNVEHTNNFAITGLLDVDENPKNIVSADFDRKYFLAFPSNGTVFMWDYEISPYFYSSSNGETSPSKLSWFYFDRMYVKEFVPFEKKLLYLSSYLEPVDVGQTPSVDFRKHLVELNNSFEDLDYDDDGVGDPIESYYQTPFLQFGSTAMLKNIKAVYIQTRGDTSAFLDISYYTNDSVEPEHEPDYINVNTGDSGRLWNSFTWDNFIWFVKAWANTFRRKCNLKKVQMVAFRFDNSEFRKDMSITDISVQYQLVRYVR